MHKHKMSLATVLAVLSLAVAVPAIAGPSGTINVHNNTSMTLMLAADTFPGSPNFPTTIAASASSGPIVVGTTGTTLSGTITYNVDGASGDGCMFTTLVNPNGTGGYNFTFNKAATGAPPSPAVCTYTASRDTGSGTFAGNATIAGF